MMNILPNFENYGYQVLEKLSHNYQEGRLTYKAINIDSGDLVIIKQFRFVTGGDWSSHKQVEREIEVLKSLNHGGIPRYLSSFDLEDGFCLVQEYKDALDLSHSRSFTPEEIKEIAIQLLEILIYLQNRKPLIVHRDIKPENILVEIAPQSPLKNGQEIKVYLVDFGLARIGGEITALSSMVAGTTGFMPPEQLLNKSLTAASDLYGLGATLICLLTGKKSVELSSLVNHEFQIEFKPLVTRYSLRFIDWIDKMVDPDVNQRFENAQAALDKLQALDIIRVPVVSLNKLELEFTAEKIGEIIIEKITIFNDVSNTILEGEWSVFPHKNDPPHTPNAHAWIKFTPKKFKGNRIECKVAVDTWNLKANRVYEREIVLSSNAEQENHFFKIKVKTAIPIVAVKKPPYLFLLAICLVNALGLSIAGGWIFLAIFGVYAGGIVGCFVGAHWGFAVVTSHGFNSNNATLESVFLLFVWVFVGAIFGAILGAIFGWIFDATFNKFKVQGLNQGFAWLYILLSSGFGTSIGIGKIVGLNPYLVLALVATGLPLAGMLLYTPIKQKVLIAQHRKRESQQNLIEP